MAHEIYNTFTGIVLSSALRRVDISADGEYLDAELATASGKVLLAERYYAYQSEVTIYDLATLVEDEMRASGTTYAEFTLSVFSGNHQNKNDNRLLRVIYCDRMAAGSDVALFLRENFLTSLSARRAPMGAPLSLSFFANKGESISAVMECRSRHIPSGMIFVHQFHHDAAAVASASGIYATSVDFSEIVTDAAEVFDCQANEVEPLAVTVSVGQRSVTQYFDRALRCEDNFHFRNCFNVEEVAYLPTSTTGKTDVERSTAIINGRSRAYDQSATKAYEVEAGPLTFAEAEWLEQLIASHYVARMVESKLQPILITDQTCEVKDSEVNSLKFTWRYADNRPMAHLSASPSIFSQQFSTKFS